MDDMNNRPGPDEGSNEHLAAAGGSDVGGHGGSGTPTSGDELFYDPADDPRLAAFLDRSAEVLQAGPDELTAHRHLAAMRKEMAAAAPAPARPGVLRVAGISAAAAIALVVTLAGFGALPAPAQQVLSDVADRVGITIPSPADRSPSSEVPAKQQPAPETVPGRPGGPDRSELPGPAEDGRRGAPGADDTTTPPGRSGDRPGQGNGRDEAPGQDRRDEAPGNAPDEPPGQSDPPGREEAPGNAPDEPPGQNPSEDPPGSAPDEPPGQSDPPDNAPDEPPGQSDPPGNAPDDPPGRSDNDESPASERGSDASQENPGQGNPGENQGGGNPGENQGGGNTSGGGPP